MKKDKDIFKLTNLLLDEVCKLRRHRMQFMQKEFESFAAKCFDIVRNSALHYMALEKKWFQASERIKIKTIRNLKDFSVNFNRFKEFINKNEPKLPEFSDVYKELLQIVEDLGEFQFDPKENTLSVTTEPITLEDIDLGPFEIKLFIDQISGLYNAAPYKVIALEPNPAGIHEEVTHPHVSSNMLCEGNGSILIRKAMENGRFYDFFTIIVNILNTYNPGSPYVSLHEWQGQGCYDCGRTVTDDETYICELCEERFCGYCSTCCQKCDETICLGCSYHCPSCEESVCNNCTAKCKECEETYCKDCLTEEGLCPDCEEQRKETEDDKKKNKPNKSETVTAVQPDGLGKTVVHA